MVTYGQITVPLSELTDDQREIAESIGTGIRFPSASVLLRNERIASYFLKAKKGSQPTIQWQQEGDVVKVWVIDANAVLLAMVGEN